jgi:hypothetical protein
MTALGLAVVITVQMLSINGSVYDAMSTDDIMRLVEVREFINGKNWFDLWQNRLNPPGVLMHWSRVIDVPLAGLVLALRPVIGASEAELVTLYFWPLALFAVTISLCLCLGRQLAGKAFAAPISILILAILARPMLAYFRPGSIDHHNAQLCLILALLLFALQSELRPGRAALAGLAASLSLAIGLEMLPTIAAISVALVGIFIWRGAAVGRSAALYAMALALSSAVLACVLLPWASIGLPVCDALGGPSLLLTVGSGLMLAAMVGIDSRWPGVWSRLSTAVISCAIIMGAFTFLFKGCIGSPYASLDPLIVSLWLDKVQETVSLWGMFRLGPEEVPSFYALPLLTIGLAIFALVRSAPLNRPPWIISIAALTMQFAISAWELRGAGGTAALSVPIFVGAVVTVWPNLTKGCTLPIMALAVSPTAFLIFGAALKPLTDSMFKPNTVSIIPDARRCEKLSDAAPLERLPKGRMIAPIDLGPAILAETEQDIFAAPYHRNSEGNLIMLKLMLATPQAAHEMLTSLDVDYIVTCRTAPNGDIIDLAPDGLEARLARGDAPAFLAPIDLGASAKISVWKLLR